MASRHDRSASKKRRLTRACDMCKRKKIRCDGVEMPGNQCTNCLNSKVHCTHVEVLRNLGTAKGYVESLERRLQKLTQLFKKLLPEVDIDQELDDTEDSIDEENERTAATNEETSIQLSYAVNRALNFAPQRQRYFGKSNALFLIQAVAAQRAHYLGKRPSLNPSFSLKQGEHWAARPWYNPRHRYTTQEYEFPEEDLLTALVDAYFEHENCFLPLLHRPTFERAIQDQVHYHDEMFGGTLLMVCALGARWVDDRRVFTEGVDMAGWPYFDQISLPPPPDGPVSLGEMQMYCLYITYHQLIPTARTMWIYLGTAFRLIQDAGMHMRSPNPPNAQDELWKRVFWCLMFLDISYASVFGHTPTLHYEMFDIEYPIECDDEYWENEAFAQPKDKPSSISFFVQLMKLMQILSYVLRVTYAVRRPLHVFTANRLPEAQILAGFDSSLNEWQAALPDNLRWDPRRREEHFFRQSAFLHITMYYVQIQAHRPYIPGPDQKHSVLPSLAICSNAALSCMRIVETQKYRGYLENVHIMAYLYPAAMILLLRAWSVPAGDTLPSATQEMKFVQVCLDMFKRCQKRPNAPPAFIFWDIIAGLMTDDTSPRPISPTKGTGRPKGYQAPEENEFPPYTHPLQPAQQTHQNSVFAVPVNATTFTPEPVVHSYVPYHTPDGTNFVVQQNTTATDASYTYGGAYYQEQQQQVSWVDVPCESGLTSQQYSSASPQQPYAEPQNGFAAPAGGGYPPQGMWESLHPSYYAGGDFNFYGTGG